MNFVHVSLRYDPPHKKNKVDHPATNRVTSGLVYFDGEGVLSNEAESRAPLRVSTSLGIPPSAARVGAMR
ncbi:hypothetical protein ACNREE_11045 [Ralstonia pseudosolanacearum]|uniref:hypothetical protein n=1 Tax=Ralstonia pseudosolanacearum TaxID=1310165 RepID=UPI003AAF970A